MRVWQPGGHLSSIKKVEVDDWSWRRTRRRIAELARLTKPYKARTALSIVSLLAATATALAPPFLAKYAVDDAISKNDLGLLWWIVGAFVARRPAQLGDELRRRPTSRAGSASASWPTCALGSSAISSGSPSVSTSAPARA